MLLAKLEPVLPGWREWQCEWWCEWRWRGNGSSDGWRWAAQGRPQRQLLRHRGARPGAAPTYIHTTMHIHPSNSLLVNDEHAGGAAHKGAVRGQQPHRSCAPDGHTVALPHLCGAGRQAQGVWAAVRGRPAGRQARPVQLPSVGLGSLRRQQQRACPQRAPPISQACQAVGRMSDSSTTW